MRSLIVLLLFITSIATGQTLTTPNSQNIPVGVTGLPISGFSLDGFDASTSYKVSLAITGNANARFSVGTTTGLTRDYGYYSWTNITAVNFFGTPANIQNAFNSITFNTTNTIDGLINLSVVVSSQQANTYYNPTNGHMYKFVQGPITWSSARANAKASTFEGQSGYLVTITSADEQSFVNSKVSAYNIWTGLSDETQEGYWKWMDGPEAGTVIRIGTTNQSGKYNNWASGEPNNWGSGEDYMVMKWSGGTQWNDFGPPATTSTSQIGGYLIEYGTWTDPSESTFNSTQNAQITFTQKDMLWVEYKFNFGNGITPTNFNGKMYHQISEQEWGTNNTTDLSLTTLGKVNTTSQIQEETLGKKATTVGGNVEWCIIYDYDANLDGHRFLIDEREFANTGVNPADVKQIQLFDLYDGDVTVYNVSGFWKQYILPGDLTTQISNSNYSSYLRRQDNWYGTRAEVSFADYIGYKPQSFIFNSPPQNTIETLIDDVVTVTDVVLAFNELAGGGINGGLKGDLNGIQLGNADVNGDNNFDFQDTYKLLQHLTGAQSLVESTNTLVYLMKIKTKSDYESTTTSNWKSKYNGTTLMAGVDLTNSLVNFPEYNITWRGDVNLSHSPASAGAVTQAKFKSTPISKLANKTDILQVLLDSEIADGILVTDISIPANNQNIGGAQFRLGFDDSRLEFLGIEFSNSSTQNFNSVRSQYINFGSIDTNGQNTLSSETKYKLKFKLKQDIKSSFGLTALTKTEIVTAEGITIISITK